MCLFQQAAYQFLLACGIAPSVICKLRHQLFLTDVILYCFIRKAVQIIPKIDIVVPFSSVPSDHMDVVCTGVLFKITHYKQQLSRNIFSAKNNIMLFEQFNIRRYIVQVADAYDKINNRFCMNGGNSGAPDMLDVNCNRF